MLKPLCLLASLLLLAYTLSAQNFSITGQVKDSAGNALPYALVYLKGTGIGASANVKGLFAMSAPKGQYTLVIKSLGYQTEERPLSVSNSNLVINLNLHTNSYQLQGLNIYYADPALSIIKKTIARRNYYRKQIRDYRCRVYIKGGVLIDSVKTKLFGQVISDTQELKRTKFLYLSESLSDYYAKGKKTKEVIIASKVSGDIPYTINSNSFLMTDFLNNKVDGVLATRSFVSPIADNAPYYYKYKLIGTVSEGNNKVYKIMVTPRRRNEPCLTGYVLIADSAYRLCGANLSAYKENGLELIDTLTYKQEYIDINDTLAMPGQMQLHFHLRFFGIGFNGNFLGIYSQYKVNTNFSDKIFDNTLYKITDTANKKARPYWDTLRPLQLTDAETTDYKFKDSVALVHSSKRFMDSMDDKTNGRKRSGIFAFKNSYHKIYFGFRYTGFFNVVEGVSVALPFYFRKEWKDGDKISIEPFVRYGLSDKKWKYGLSSLYSFNQKLNASLQLKAAVDVLPIDDEVFQRFVTAESEQNIFFRQNFLKWYQKNYVSATYHQRLLRGIYLKQGIECSYRNQLFSKSDYSLIHPAGRDYTPNNIAGAGGYASTQFLSITHITFSPFEKYVELPHQKIAIASNWPTLDIDLRIAIPGVLNATAQYSLLTININHSVNLGLKGIVLYSASAGKFLSSPSLTLFDYKHFAAAPWFFNNAPLGTYGLLAPLSASTARQYIEGHVEYKLRGFITNKIPGFNRLKWFLLGGANYLYAPESGQYTELYAGIENILKLLSVRYFVPVAGMPFRATLRVHINIPVESFIGITKVD